MKESKKRRSLFKLGNISRKHFILYILSPFTYYFNNKFSDYVKKENTWYNSSLNFFSIYLGYILIGGILLIYSKIINKKEISHKQEKIQTKIIVQPLNEFIINDTDIDEPVILTKKIIFLFIIIVITDCLCTYIFTTFQKFPNFFKYLGYLYPLEIISFIILSKFILKLKINKHHLFSLIIIIIGLLIINIINFTSITYNLNELFVIFGLLSLQYLYPLLDIIIYYILYEKDFNFSLYVLLNGIMGMIIGIIMSLCKEYLSLTFLNINIFQDLTYFKNNTLSKFLWYLLMSISNGITYSLLLSIFKLFKPWAYAITAVINGLLTTFHDILNVLFEKKIFNFFLLFQIIIYIILFIACLIFNEQIICNFWELNKNTKEEITNRGKRDLEITQEIVSLEEIK